jgi:hypothetical protein
LSQNHAARIIRRDLLLSLPWPWPWLLLLLLLLLLLFSCHPSRSGGPASVFAVVAAVAVAVAFLSKPIHYG